MRLGQILNSDFLHSDVTEDAPLVPLAVPLAAVSLVLVPALAVLVLVLALVSVLTLTSCPKTVGAISIVPTETSPTDSFLSLYLQFVNVSLTLLSLLCHNCSEPYYTPCFFVSKISFLVRKKLMIP